MTGRTKITAGLLIFAVLGGGVWSFAYVPRALNALATGLLGSRMASESWHSPTQVGSCSAVQAILGHVLPHGEQGMALTFTETETLVGELEDAGGHPAMRPFPLPPLFQRHPQGGRRNGQPGNFSAFQPRYSELARGYCLLGAGNAQLAQLFGISVTTLQTWMDRHPEFAAAIEEGRTHADLLVANAYFRRAAGCTAGRAGDPA